MSKRIICLTIGAALAACAALPGAAAAADLYGYAGEDRPPVYGGRDDGFADRGYPPPPAHRYAFHRDPGPVAFDERAPGERFGGPDGYRGPVEPPPYGYGRPAAFVPPAGRFYGGEDLPAYRPVAAPGGPGLGGPDGGCTVEQTRSTTPAGWRKVETYRTCYSR